METDIISGRSVTRAVVAVGTSQTTIAFGAGYGIGLNRKNTTDFTSAGEIKLTLSNNVRSQGALAVAPGLRDTPSQMLRAFARTRSKKYTIPITNPTFRRPTGRGW